jgi:MOSC domain-containing protein YiiM
MSATSLTVGRVESINVGVAREISRGDRSELSGIYKQPHDGAIEVAVEGLPGDVQIDRRYHGGPDKALCVYAADHFEYWCEQLDREILPGAFGENLTTRGLLEDETAVGDVFRIGTALLQVTQPRQPCWKLAARHGEKQLVRWVEKSSKTGFYLRCLEPGMLTVGDPIERVERPETLVSIVEANRIIRSKDRGAIQRLLSIAALSEAWRRDLESRVVDL